MWFQPWPHAYMGLFRASAPLSGFLCISFRFETSITRLRAHGHAKAHHEGMCVSCVGLARPSQLGWLLHFGWVGSSISCCFTSHYPGFACVTSPAPATPVHYRQQALVFVYSIARLQIPSASLRLCRPQSQVASDFRNSVVRNFLNAFWSR